MKILPSCLNSIETQSVTEFETIVVDDGSTDGSTEMIRSDFPWVRLIVNPKNYGLARTKNVGLEAASAELVGFLDNDATIDEFWLENMLTAFDEDPEVAAMASHILFYDNPRVLNSTGGLLNLAGYGWDRNIFDFEADVSRQMDPVIYACGAAMMVRKSVANELGNFDSDYEYPFEDVDFGWRANLAGYKVMYNPDALAYHQLSATMGSWGPRQMYLTERARIRTLKKNLEPETLRNIRGDLVHLYLGLLRSNLHQPAFSRRRRLWAVMKLMQAVAWNLRKSPGTRAWRAKVSTLRKRSDLDLIRDGLMNGTIEHPVSVMNSQLPDYQPRVMADLKIKKMDRLNMYDGCAEYLGPGWYNKEFTPDFTAFRWTKEEAVCYLIPSRRPRNLVLKTIAADPLKGANGRIKINGELAGEFYVLNGPQTIETAVPSSEENIYEVRIIVDNPFRPSEALHNGDQRKLGLGVSKIYLTS